VAYGLLPRRRLPALGYLLLAGAALYPATLALRLTQAGTETSNRASEFIFLGVGLAAATALVRLRARGRSHATGVLVATLTAVFAGGIIIGWSPASRLPGEYMVGADPRSVDPYGESAARWARGALPWGSRVFGDRTNALLMAAYARQTPVDGTIHGLPVAGLLTDQRFDARSRRIITLDRVRYVVIDRRLSSARPAVGYYVERDERLAYAYRRPVSHEALLKFERVNGLSRIYDSGAIVIYDASRLLDLPVTGATAA
jgi:hypothetical protein